MRDLHSHILDALDVGLFVIDVRARRVVYANSPAAGIADPASVLSAVGELRDAMEPGRFTRAVSVRTAAGRDVYLRARHLPGAGPRVLAVVTPAVLRQADLAALLRARGLSLRHAQIADLLGAGATNREIADRLQLAVGTVKNYLTDLLDVFGVRNRTELVIRLARSGAPGTGREDPEAGR